MKKLGLKFFRPQHGQEQIAEQRDGNKTHDDILHGASYNRSQKQM
jgi:hypothetical protein